MTVATATPHVTALVAVLTNAGIPTGDGTKPDTASPKYVVIDAGAGLAEQRALSDLDGLLTLDPDIEAFGVSAEQARWVQDKVRTTLHAATLTVTGRAIERVRQTGIGPVLRDDDTPTATFSIIATYRLRSRPA